MPATPDPLPPPSTDDPFDLLGLPPDFDIDPGRLARAYLSLSVKLHPDLARGEPDAARLAAAANRARATLEDPESRAGALLARLGGPAKDADKSLPGGFLAEILETREQIEAATASGDPVQFERWRSWAIDRRSEYTARIAGLFRRYAAAPAEPVLRDIRRELNAWRYIERLIEQLEPGYNPSEADFPAP